MTFGERVRTRRMELGLTQKELADKLGYRSKSSINKIELGGRNMKQSQIAQLAAALDTTPAHLMGWDEPENLPEGLSIPAAHPVPILGTICCGNGTAAEQHFEGEFFIDRSIRADYCLLVRGDSMVDAHIYDGDYAFLREDYEFQDGHIYGCVYGVEQSASLKKVYRADGKLILQPCNIAYRLKKFLKISLCSCFYY